MLSCVFLIPNHSLVFFWAVFVNKWIWDIRRVRQSCLLHCCGENFVLGPIAVELKLVLLSSILC